ncbi:aspartate/glutamate racemase family protein [Xenophilus azovorans]|uniref:aspartate/glutamate racemase family protein n=1 Tax=Xenophilus azovorans TaxID=151755 RepID=UPI000571E494|nr:aspartate/glutamate racemase family protein [Xenophilus azovorans]
MKIWLQLVASAGRLPRFLQECQAQCDRAAHPGTRVTVSGTTHGALGDQHAIYLHCDAHDILHLMHQHVMGQGYDVYVMGNSLDPALQALRELLDIPVVSAFQVACSAAMTLGDRLGVVATNAKFGLAYSRLIEGYGLGPKLAGVGGLKVMRPADLDASFDDRAEAAKVVEEVETACRPLVAAGADVLLVPGPIGTILAHAGVTQILSATVIDLYPTAIKIAEGMGHLARHCGMKPSRLGLYQSPSEESRREAARLYGFGAT